MTQRRGVKPLSNAGRSQTPRGKETLSQVHHTSRYDLGLAFVEGLTAGCVACYDGGTDDQSTVDNYAASMNLRTVPSWALAGLLGFNCFLIADTQISRGGVDETSKSSASLEGYIGRLSALEVTEEHIGGAAEADSLVEGSKRAIIETGISESYFDKHFKLIKAVNEPADRRVEWAYSVNEYEAQLVDAIGFHTTGGKRTYVHGIKNQLYSTHEIVKTLSRERARRILRTCIGEFEGEAMSYRALTVPGNARLYLTGRSRVIRQQPSTKESEGEQRPKFLYVGFVDVESGKCVKKIGKAPS